MSSPAWPAIKALLERRRQVPWIGAAAMALLGAWLAWRSGWPEVLALGILLGAALHFVLRVAIDVVALVAETLMPQ